METGFGALALSALIMLAPLSIPTASSREVPDPCDAARLIYGVDFDDCTPSASGGCIYISNVKINCATAHARVYLASIIKVSELCPSGSPPGPMEPKQICAGHDSWGSVWALLPGQGTMNTNWGGFDACSHGASSECDLGDSGFTGYPFLDFVLTCTTTDVESTTGIDAMWAHDTDCKTFS